MCGIIAYLGYDDSSKYIIQGLKLLQNRAIRDFDQATQGKIAEAQRQCVNAPIQSFVSDFIGLILVRLQKIIEANNYPVKIMLQIHDAIICEVKDEFVDEWCKIFRAEMIKKPYNFRTELDSETEIGTSYGNLKVVKN
jgi:DNA polymerase-1